MQLTVDFKQLIPCSLIVDTEIFAHLMFNNF